MFVATQSRQHRVVMVQPSAKMRHQMAHLPGHVRRFSLDFEQLQAAPSENGPKKGCVQSNNSTRE